MKILIVEDDPFTGPMLVRWLGTLGYACEWEVDGYSAIRKAHVLKPDLLLLDYLLRDGTGIDVFLMFRSEAGFHDIQGIVLTGLSDEEMPQVLQEAESAGIDRRLVFRKPFAFEEMKGMLHELATRAKGEVQP